MCSLIGLERKVAVYREHTLYLLNIPCARVNLLILGSCTPQPISPFFPNAQKTHNTLVQAGRPNLRIQFRDAGPLACYSLSKPGMIKSKVLGPLSPFFSPPLFPSIWRMDRQILVKRPFVRSSSRRFFFPSLVFRLGFGFEIFILFFGGGKKGAFELSPGEGGERMGRRRFYVPFLSFWLDR